MILSDLRDYLAKHKRASLQDMVNHFGIDPDALLGMLEQWEAKGRVRRIDAAEVDHRACGSCTVCADGDPRVFEWVGRQSPS